MSNNVLWVKGDEGWGEEYGGGQWGWCCQMEAIQTSGQNPNQPLLAYFTHKLAILRQW